MPKESIIIFEAQFPRVTHVLGRRRKLILVGFDVSSSILNLWYSPPVPALLGHFQGSRCSFHSRIGAPLRGQSFFHWTENKHSTCIDKANRCNHLGVKKKRWSKTELLKSKNWGSFLCSCLPLFDTVPVPQTRSPVYHLSPLGSQSRALSI